MEKAVIEKAKADNPSSELHIIRAGEHEMIIKAPASGEFNRFMARIEAKKDATPTVLGALLFDCRVWPSVEQLQSLLDKRPGLVLSLGNEICKVAGLNLEAESEKL